MIKKVLIADDEPLIRSFLSESFKRLKKEIFLAKNGVEAINLIDKEDIDLIITDIKMPKKSGLEVLKHAKAKKPNTIVIMITAFGKTNTAIEALNLGAFNYLVKPFSFETLKAIVAKVEHYQSLISENFYLKQRCNSAESFDIVAASTYMQNLLKNIEKIAISSSSVFISGESGTGKEVIAKFIHEQSKRKNNPFIKVNCAAISPTLLESEFFGHEKGAFTGATDQKKGRFELANSGSLLLDEITEIPINLQAKLLRVLQEKEVERVGSTKSIKIDIRFISITNRDIQEEIKNNLFREDLFYRLNVIPINILPLRKRKDDILPLANYFLQKFSSENHKALKKLTNKATKKLLDYPWPGNVRELANIIERTVVMDLSQTIQEEHIILDVPKKDILHEKDQYLDEKLSDVEKILILKTLEKQKYNRSKTAKILGITTRTLRNKLNLYNREKTIS